jgi:YD repeat-containing protein
VELLQYRCSGYYRRVRFVSGGDLAPDGKGGWSFYASNGSGGYTDPAGDSGTLAPSGGGWSYTSSDGEALAFDASGRMTTWTSADGTQTLTYTYSGSGSGTAAQVAAMTSPDGGVATFNYSAGQSDAKLRTRAEPKTRPEGRVCIFPATRRVGCSQDE